MNNEQIYFSALNASLAMMSSLIIIGFIVSFLYLFFFSVQYNVLLVVLLTIMPRYRYVLIISFNTRETVHMAFTREHHLIFTLE